MRIFQVDAFASRPFQGNPAAVVPLDAWLDDAVLQAIADENNLSETAFFVPDGDGFRLRWFTPAAEVDLCGHATLASAHVLFTHLGYAGDVVRFHTRSGTLEVRRAGAGYAMDLPASTPQIVEAPPALLAGLGGWPHDVLAAADYLVLYGSEADILALNPDFGTLRLLGLRGVVATAPGTDVDFVSRCFYPKLRVDEDPVTGSAHCALAPYWAARLGKSVLTARQLSRRGGALGCEVVGDRVVITGTAADYLTGELFVG